jgi:hypothetical protein
MTLSFVPRKLISTYQSEGWTLVPDYSAPHGWAVLMSRPETGGGE